MFQQNLFLVDGEKKKSTNVIANTTDVEVVVVCKVYTEVNSLQK